jgi:hypothetical protein
MRKALKAKVFILMAAWLVIFLHDAIPHNHDSSPEHKCHSLIHSTTSGHNNSTDGEGVDADDKVSIPDILHRTHNHGHSVICHFSSGLYRSHGVESVVAILTDNSVYLISQQITAVHTPEALSPVIAPPIRLNPLRGPPRIA